ncbi:translation initiation factor IF-3, mitochondrial isoform X1 [Drosophila hydei]|uniref:Translation initiation factor IF-3, mitochondrial isoform X1 n=1 Tax=Drosophila hydei TaxID=7224 RepID=A0A6J1LPJ5_DROHY|nr:translation initiation factor IF-3, mitochondrial isoform X1 [Drosophila hydei]
MQQNHLNIIRSLLAFRSLTLQIPKYHNAINASPSAQPQIFNRNLTQAITPKTKTDDQKSKKLKQKITLIAQNEAISITTLEEAQKLAKRRDLHLLRLQQPDVKTGRVMFKLVTSSEMLADETLGKGASKSADTQGLRKSEKSLSIGARMADHDLSSRLKNIIKWLNKRHEVRILIQGSVNGADEGNAERIVKAIEMTIKEPQVIGKIVQKRQKGSYIKFNIIPLAAAAETEASTVKEL